MRIRVQMQAPDPTIAAVLSVVLFLGPSEQIGTRVRSQLAAGWLVGAITGLDFDSFGFVALVWNIP